MLIYVSRQSQTFGKATVAGEGGQRLLRMTVTPGFFMINNA